MRFVSSLGSPGQIARETSTQWPPGPATSSDGRTQSVASKRFEPAILNSGSADAVRAVEHHVHRPAAAALRDEVLLARREHLALGLPRLEVLEEDPEALGVDAHRLAHRRELELRLDRARMVERDVPADELAAPLQRGVVADRHHVVEPVDADALAAHLRPRATRPAGRRTPAGRSTSSRARRRSALRVGKTIAGSPSTGSRTYA